MSLDEWDIEITPTQLENFLRKYKKPAVKVLEILGRNQPFYHAVHTPIGKELLKNLMDRLDVLSEKLVSGEMSAEERAEYQVCRTMLQDWSQKITKYQQLANKIKD